MQLSGSTADLFLAVILPKLVEKEWRRGVKSSNHSHQTVLRENWLPRSLPRSKISKTLQVRSHEIPGWEERES